MTTASATIIQRVWNYCNVLGAHRVDSSLPTLLIAVGAFN
jgi:hypothetical protein